MEKNNDQQLDNGAGDKYIPRQSFKMWIYPLILLIVLAGLGYWYYQYYSQKSGDLELSPTEVDQLQGTEKERVLKAQLKDLESRAQELNDEASRSDKFVVYIQLAEVQTELGMHQEAITSLDKIQKENVGNTRLWMTYGQVYRNMDNLAEARKNVRVALDLDPELVDNWLYMFTLLSDMDKAAQDSIYQEALQRSSNLAEIQAAYDTWKNTQ